MPAQPRLRFFLVVAVLGGFAQPSAYGFMITPNQPGATNRYVGQQSYTLPDGRMGTTTLMPVTALPVGGTAAFLAELNREFGPNGTVDPGWTFMAAPQPLQGTFQITVNRAEGTANRVGEEFRLTYIPAGTDPVNIHWIQRVVDNHKIQRFRDANGKFTTQDFGFGTMENKIDIILGAGGQKTPYYGAFSNDADPMFFDFPRRLSADQEQVWGAELYLVAEIAPKTVVIYNGISWGWQNTIATPEPATLVIAGTGIIVLGGRRLLSRKGKARPSA
jgi:hypothetical protein